MFLLIFLALSSAQAGNIGIGFGGSSNPMQGVNGAGASYSAFSQVWRTPVLKTEHSDWDFGIASDFKKFNDEQVGASADLWAIKVDLVTKLLLINNFESGLRLGAGKFSGRIAAPKIRGEVFGEPLDFFEFNYGVFWGATFGPWFWLFDLGGVDKNFKIASYDDKENMFMDDWHDTRLKFNLAYTTLAKLKIEFVGIWNTRSYSFGEYSIKPMSTLTVPPVLVKRSAQIIQEDYFIVVKPFFDGFEAESSVGMGQDLDRTNGAVSQKRQRISQKFEFLLWGRPVIKFVPLVDVTLRSFPFYPIYSMEFAESSPIPRQDFLVLVSAGFSMPLWRPLEGIVRLSRLESSSNSAAQNYSEDVVETGINASF